MGIRHFSTNLIQSICTVPTGVAFLSQHGIKPFHIPTQLTITERILLYSLATRLQKGAILVEIGSHLGGSSQFLACAAQRLSGKLYCVDTWKSHGMTIQRGDTYDEFARNIRSYGSKVIPLRGYSKEIASQFIDQIDLLFIDGDHSYDGCLTDIQAWSPHLVSGATVIFHDYSWADGVRSVIEEMIVPIQITSGSIVHGTYWTKVDTDK